jgi:putative autotransporter adhesin-like protein
MPKKSRETMKKLLLISILIAAGLTSFSACRFVGKGVQGSGVRKTEKRDLPAFKSIETNGAFAVQVSCQQAASFEIEGDDNLLPLVKTEVRNGVLRIYNDASYTATKAISVRMAIPDLEAISSTGAADIHVTNVKNNQLTISWQGAGRIEGTGETKFVSISSTGAGKIDTGRLHAERAKVSVTGAAQVDVYASQQLDVTVSGVGQVTYDGNPGVVNKSVSGLGSVNKKG